MSASVGRVSPTGKSFRFAFWFWLSGFFCGFVGVFVFAFFAGFVSFLFAFFSVSLFLNFFRVCFCISFGSLKLRDEYAGIEPQGRH